jgi:hypothetical protein
MGHVIEKSCLPNEAGEEVGEDIEALILKN